MNIIELQQALRENNISPKYYSINQGEKDESYILLNENGKWLIFYSERGLRTGCEFFKNESSACEVFFDQLSKDPTVKEI